MKLDLDRIRKYLREYDGPDIHIMEVCGSHTGAIARNGIPGMLSPSVHLVSGPGCPVCVTPSAYIDRLIEISLRPHHCVVTFGDLLRVPGSTGSLSQAKGRGARVAMVYSPMDIFPLAEAEPETTFVFAAVGFETTAPVYALMVEQILEDHIANVKLLTAIKSMPEVIDWLCAQSSGESVGIQGFLAPGHVAVVTGSCAFEPLAKKYQLPFAVAGFSGEEILTALYGIAKLYKDVSDEESSEEAGKHYDVRQSQGNQKRQNFQDQKEPPRLWDRTGESALGEVRRRKLGRVMNFYPSVVTAEGNVTAQKLMDRYFDRTAAVWRGMGRIPGSGRVLKPEYAELDAGSIGLDEDRKINRACCCDKVLTGRMSPTQCPLFKKGCR